jgi:PKD repeat protein
VSGLLSLDVHPVTGELLAVVLDAMGSYFLARLDLNAVDASNPLNKKLAIHLIGLLGSSQGAGSGFAVSAIAFDTTSGELYGAGMNLTSPGIHPTLVKIQTTPSTLPLALAIGQPAATILSFPLGMAYANGVVFATGFQGSVAPPPGTVPPHVLIAFDPQTGLETVAGEFNSLSGTKVAGKVTGLAVVTTLPPGPPLPLDIESVYPEGGNCGILVTIRGQGFSANKASIVTAVEFNGIPALNTPLVISDEELRVLAPTISQPGKIKVVTQFGGKTSEALSPKDFIPSTLTIILEERTQGLSTYPLVAGKDTLFRLLTASSAAAAAGAAIPVTFQSASLTLTAPDGKATKVPAQFYTSRFMNPPKVVNPSERYNINFYVSGDVLDQSGDYKLEYAIQGAGGCTLAGPAATSVELQPHKDDLTVLIFWGGVYDGTSFVLPDQGSQSAIFEVFEEMGRVYPVRNGVSKLGQDLTAGVRFAISSYALPLSSKGLGSIVINTELAEAAEVTVKKLLDEYNDKNPSDPARFGAVWYGDEMLDFNHTTYVGIARHNEEFSLSILPDKQRDLSAVTALHEIGHNLGLVPASSPNHNPENSGHSKNEFIPPAGSPVADPTKPGGLRAFNVPGHLSVHGTDGPATAIMFDPIWTLFISEQHDGCTFHEAEEYVSVYNALPPAPGINKATFSLVAEIKSDDTADLLLAYESAPGKMLTAPDASSPYALTFLDAAGQVLAQEPFSVSFSLQPTGAGIPVDVPYGVARVVRPLPDGTAQVQIRKGPKVLTASHRSSSPPSVAVLFPAGGESFGDEQEVLIRWAGSSPDPSTAPLRYSVSYSPDGVQWTPIAAGIGEQSVGWHPRLAAGSAQGRIRVTASDGFRVASADSPSFAVAPKPPTAGIRRPRDGQTFLQFERIVLEGMGFDPELGVLGGAALQWSAGQVILGTGPKLELAPETLAPGVHEVTFCATDGTFTACDSVTIAVLSDADGDGLPDAFENQFASQDPDDPYDAGQDVDGDGLSTSLEYLFGTNPENADSDGDGLSDGQEVALGKNPLVSNRPPLANAGGPYAAQEGSAVTLVGAGSFDPDGDLLTYSWTFGDGGSAGGANVTHVYADDGNYTVTLTVADPAGLSSTASTIAAIANVPPEVGAISAPVAPVRVWNPVSASGTFTDRGTLDTHAAIWDWGDGTASAGTVTETNGAGSVGGSHVYTEPGVYTVQLVVTDDDGGSGEACFRYVVVYDPEGGFVTGGGWITSPIGAYAPDPSLTGKASFGFVAKYKKGATVPVGHTEFQFRAAGLNFQSDTYQWLVVSGARAQFKGWGTMNGDGEYGFLLSAVDGQVKGGGGIDKFRIKIWDKATQTIVYDNQRGAADDAEPANAIAGGSIVVHR